MTDPIDAKDMKSGLQARLLELVFDGLVAPSELVERIRSSDEPCPKILEWWSSYDAFYGEPILTYRALDAHYAVFRILTLVGDLDTDSVATLDHSMDSPGPWPVTSQLAKLGVIDNAAVPECLRVKILLGLLRRYWERGMTDWTAGHLRDMVPDWPELMPVERRAREHFATLSPFFLLPGLGHRRQYQALAALRLKLIEAYGEMESCSAGVDWEG